MSSNASPRGKIRLSARSDQQLRDAVLAAVNQIPRGKVSTYDDVATAVQAKLGRGSSQQVKRVLNRAGGSVPWWRVVTANGRPPTQHLEVILPRLRDEGVVFHIGEVDVDLSASGFRPLG